MPLVKQGIKHNCNHPNKKIRQFGTYFSLALRNSGVKHLLP
jgi:hypothetical protein